MLEKANNNFMNNENNSGAKASVLPPDFDGVFRFTNFTKKEFKAKWGGIEYTFPPQSTIPMIIPGATPEEVQHIRKKFAKELAILEFYETKKFKSMNDVAPGGVPALYTDSDLAPFIQRCLEPLPAAQAVIRPLPPMGNADQLRKDEEGNNVTQILDKKKSLLQEGSGVVA